MTHPRLLSMRSETHHMKLTAIGILCQNGRVTEAHLAKVCDGEIVCSHAEVANKPNTPTSQVTEAQSSYNRFLLQTVGL